MRVPSLLAALITLACATRAGAQLAPLEPGDRIRLRLESKQQLTAELVSATPDSLTLRIHPDATPTTVPIAAVRSLEVSVGTASAWTSAVNAALLGGGLLGSQLALAEGAEGRELGKHAGWGATIGAVVGLAVGSIFRDERWSPLSLPPGSVERAEALRFPSFAISGRWGPVSGRAGEGRGRGGRFDAGVARLGEDTQLRAEISFERSALRSGPVAYSEELGIIASREDNRRYSYGLTLVENAWRLGERLQTYVSFGLGATQSRVTGEMRWACSPAYPCNVGGVAYGFDSSRDHRGTYALAGFGVVARVNGVNAFAEIRSQMMDDGANEPGTFVPFTLGVSF